MTADTPQRRSLASATSTFRRRHATPQRVAAPSPLAARPRDRRGEPALHDLASLDAALPLINASNVIPSCAGCRSGLGEMAVRDTSSPGPLRLPVRTMLSMSSPYATLFARPTPGGGGRSSPTAATLGTRSSVILTPPLAMSAPRGAGWASCRLCAPPTRSVPTTASTRWSHQLGEAGRVIDLDNAVDVLERLHTVTEMSNVGAGRCPAALRQLDGCVLTSRSPNLTTDARCCDGPRPGGGVSDVDPS